MGRLPSITLERIEGKGVRIQVRGTEPRLTNVTIDGTTIPSPEPDVRQIRLDVIPADLVEFVEVNKPSRLIWTRWHRRFGQPEN